MRRAHGVPFACKRLHFQRLVFPWTDLSLGNCSYLDTCRHMKTCRFVHYQLDDDQEQPELMGDVMPARPTKQAVPSYLEVSTVETDEQLRKFHSLVATKQAHHPVMIRSSCQFY